MDSALLTDVELEVLDAVRAIISCARKDCITGSKYDNVLPEPVAAAKATLRTGGMDANCCFVEDVSGEETSTSKDEEDEEELFAPLFLIFSIDAIRSLQPDKISGMAIFCTGVGPSINPRPPADTSRVTPLTRSSSKPSFDHSNAPSNVLPSAVSVTGIESSNDERGAWNGKEDLAEALFVLLSGAGTDAVVE
jgi:hypothetical protein